MEDNKIAMWIYTIAIGIIGYFLKTFHKESKDEIQKLKENIERMSTKVAVQEERTQNIEILVRQEITSLKDLLTAKMDIILERIKE